MNSIATRLGVGAVVVLAAFVIFTAVAIQQAVEKRAQAAQFDRLQGLIYGLLGAADFLDDGTLVVDEFALPDGQLNQPGAGLVAQIHELNGSSLWRSNSLIFELPKRADPIPGEWQLSRVQIQDGDEFFHMHFTVQWVLENEREQTLVFNVAQNTDSFDRVLSRFDTQLWLVLLIASGLLLLILIIVLYWSLHPLKRVTSAVAEVQNGNRDQLPDDVPRELTPLSDSLNELLRNEQRRQTRYKNALDDLAHSLKTPLAVIRNAAADDACSTHHTEVLKDQVQTMDDIIASKLRSVAITNRSPISHRVNVRTLVERIVNSLNKVYADKTLKIAIEIDPSYSFKLHEGDAMEVLGNLIENACKYGRKNVLINASQIGSSLEISVFDDGPGFALDLVALSERGVRADNQSRGQGLGLSIVHDLMNNLGGKIEQVQSPLGGAGLSVKFSGYT
ncbi:MAG: ATP-binding protein [Pseudomonadota bacterium]